MKDLAKKALKTFFSTNLSLKETKRNILFPHINTTLLPVIKSGRKNFCGIHFVPEVELSTTFNWRRKELSNEDFIRFSIFYRVAKNYIDSKGIDYFVVDRLTRNNLLLHAFLEACNDSKRVITIYLDHGETGSIHSDVEFDRISNYNYYYTPNSEMEEYMYNNYYRENLLIREWKRPTAKIKKKKGNLLLFAPQFNEADRLNQLQPQTSQYLHRKVFADILHQVKIESKLIPVWKTFKGGNLQKDPMKYICALYGIKYVDNNKFNYYLARSKMVITDCVSTPFYEAVENDIPVLCLRYSKAAPIRESIIKQFGKSIFIYDRVEDCRKKVFEFINDDKHCYRHKVNHYQNKFPWEF